MVYAGEAKGGGKVQVESSSGNFQYYWPPTNIIKNCRLGDMASGETGDRRKL